MYKFLLEELNLVKTNYLGKKIPVIGGIILVFFSVVNWSFFYINKLVVEDIYNINTFIIVVIGICGLLDDIIGNKEARGFRGHFKKLQEGKITTGIAKIFITTIVGFFIILSKKETFIGEETYRGLAGIPLIYLIDLLIFVLMTNIMNLLDLRPARSIKFFIIISLLLIIFYPGIFIYFLPLYLAIIFYLPYELKAVVMLGDSGSNLLGAVLGYYLILLISSIYIKLLILFVLLFLNMMSEKYSFSRIIERNIFLKWVDNLGRNKG